MTQDELVEIIARAQYAANCWWRPVEDDDDALGRYKAGHGPDRFRAIEWEQLGDEERKELLDAAQAAIDALSSKGLAVVPVIPTGAMLDAYWEQTGESREMRARTHATMRRYYSAMLLAAGRSPVLPVFTTSDGCSETSSRSPAGRPKEGA